MKLRIGLLSLIAIVYISSFFWLGRWEDTFWGGDTNGYYLHVVSSLLYGDVGDYDQTVDALLETKPNNFDPRKDPFLIRETEVGRKYIKYTLGVAVMEAPFFLLAHQYAKWSDTYPANGWTKPYFLLVGLSIVFYVLTGFYLLIGVLQKYFSDLTVVLTTLGIAFATNLFFQTTYETMSHGYLFFDYCVLIFLTDKFYEKPSLLLGFFIGFMVGLITITRIPELLGGFIPVLWGVSSWKKFKDRIAFFGQHYQKLLLALGGFLLIFSLQLAYWKYTSGHWVFNPYEGEGFDFANPHILEGWFHFSNGWLIYTPIMFFSLVGLFVIRRYVPQALLPILFFVGAHAYIHYSYYAWTYFPGLGSRPMVETYAILSFSLGACFAFFLKQKWSVWLPFLALAFFTWLNLFQTWQMRRGIIWSERHNRAFYLASFGKTTSSMNALRAYDTRETQPDTAKIKFVKRVYFNDFEDQNLSNIDSTHARTGKYSYLSVENDMTAIAEWVHLHEAKPGDWIKVGMEAFVPSNAPKAVYNRDLTAAFILEYFDDQGKSYWSRHFKPSSHIENETGNLWHSGALDQWGHAYVYLSVPRKWNDKWTVRLLVLNGNKQYLYLDNLYIDLFRRK